jgi:hypothetical protein
MDKDGPKTPPGIVCNQKGGNGVSHCAGCEHYRRWRRRGTQTSNPHGASQTVERVVNDDVANDHDPEHNQAHSGCIHDSDTARDLAVCGKASCHLTSDVDASCDYIVGGFNDPGDGERAVLNVMVSTFVVHVDRDPLGPRQSKFTSWVFTENVRRVGLLSSMGTVGDCYDNAPMESFWGSMQIELLNRQKWRTKMELGLAMAEYIEDFYNPIRRHSSLGYLTPNEFEDVHSTTSQLANFVLKSGPLNGVKPQVVDPRGHYSNPPSPGEIGNQSVT